MLSDVFHMPFRDRFVVRGKLDAKFYFHTGGREIYGGNNAEQVARAVSHLRYDVLTPGLPPLSGYNFLLGAVWGDKGERVVDILGFREISEWPGNPEIDTWVSREGVLRPTTKSVLCMEGGRIIFGAEGELFAASDSLRQFIDTPMPQHPLILGGETHDIRI